MSDQSEARGDTSIGHLKAYPVEFGVVFGVAAMVIASIWLSYPLAESTLSYTSLSGEDSLRWGWLVGVLVATGGMLIVLEAYSWFLKEVGVNYSDE